MLPYSMYKDVMGPDLVRHLNALTLLLNSGEHVQNPPSKPDRELFAALRDQLAVVEDPRGFHVGRVAQRPCEGLRRL